MSRDLLGTVTMQHIQQIQSVVQHIEDHLDTDTNVLELARSIGVSPWHFQRVFKSLVGDTLGGYVRGRRLSKGATLLLSTSASVLDIALEVGFGSHEAFTRSFKHYFLLSPTEFREQRPPVLLNEKPILTEALHSHLANGMDLTPNIITQPETILLGFKTEIPSPFTLNESYCDLLEAPWMALLSAKDDIEHRIPDRFYGITLSESGQFTEPTLTYLSAVPVSQDIEPPAGMVKHTLPEQTIAQFHVHTVDEDTVNKTMDYIYGYWLPNSNYVRGHGSDYELFEGLTNFEGLMDANRDMISHQLSSEYVIPIRLPDNAS